jgi:hypothetical protein
MQLQTCIEHYTKSDDILSLNKSITYFLALLDGQLGIDMNFISKNGIHSHI